MTHPGILAALARERISNFLGEAQAARQASLARAARSPARGKRIALLVAAEHAAMAGLRRSMGACLAGRGPGTVEYEVAPVTPAGDPGHDQALQPVSQPC